MGVVGGGGGGERIGGWMRVGWGCQGVWVVETF